MLAGFHRFEALSQFEHEQTETSPLEPFDEDVHATHEVFFSTIHRKFNEIHSVGIHIDNV